jgi:type IV secretion system protein VirB6
VVYIAFLVMLAKLAVAVLLGVAPFFILLYLFEGTKTIFEGWLRQLISFALIPIFLYGLLALVINIVRTMSDQMIEATANEVWGITHVGPYALVMLVSLLLATQVMGWAAGVGGGFSLSSVGALSRVSRRSALATGAGATLAYRALSRRLGNRGIDDLDGNGARRSTPGTTAGSGGSRLS